MQSGYDINQIRNDGYLIVPLSMARLHKGAGQDPEESYEIPDFFVKKLDEYSSDVVFLYTNGIYFNSIDISFERREKLNQQMLQHNERLQKVIKERRQYMPRAFHYLPIDYVMLNSSVFREYFTRLQKLEQEDTAFQMYLQEDGGDREYNDANVNFLLEEIVVAHILRQRLVTLPRTLVRNDIWRLIVYPGPYMRADVYQWQNNVLPKSDTVNPFRGAQYDFNERKMYAFDEITLPNT